jgi:phenylacetate-CoA ligase
MNAPIQSSLPIYHQAIDWPALYRDYPVPDVFEQTVYRWSADRVRELQSRRFLDVMQVGWRNPFYRKRWQAVGLEPGDIASLDDIVKLPTINSEDIKQDQLEHPPFGEIHDAFAKEYFGRQPVKVQTSGGTTGKPRATLYGPIEWELNGLGGARCLYILGARPGDVAQIPATNSLANIGWSFYKACHDYLGILPVTTGSGIVTPSRRQLEYAFDWGTNIWTTFPEYLMQLAKVCRDELKRDVRELKTKMIVTFLGPDIDNAFRRELENVWGCDVYDVYGTHEMGGGGFECKAKSGMHLMEDSMYFEVLDAETNAPNPIGEAGNLVVTIFFRHLPPLIRYNVRDLGRIISVDQCSCGSCFRRMDKFLGRSDDMVKLRGVNIYPMACLPAVKSDPRTSGEWLCVVDRQVKDGVPRDEMTVRIEVRKEVSGDPSDLQLALERRLQSDLGVKVAVELVPEGNLAEAANIGREGKVRRLLDRRFQKP